MHIYDVVICGAGPSGSTAGYILAQKGLDVLIVDRKMFPRFKLCGGLLTWKTQKVLERIYNIDEQELRENDVLNLVTYEYGIGLNDSPPVTGGMDYPFWLVDRQQYDALMLNKYKNEGGRLYCPQTVTDIDFREGTVYLENGETVRGRFIIGADGAVSAVRRHLARAGRVSPPCSLHSALALEVQVERASADFPEYPCIYFGNVPGGYSWSFPQDDTQYLGLGSEKAQSPQNLKGVFTRFCHSQGVEGIEEKIRGHVLPYGDFESFPGMGNVLLCGDAAGLADPLLGEGVFYAHYSALNASNAVLQCWSTPDEAAQTYSRQMREVFWEMRYAYMWRKVTLNFLRVGNFAGFRMLLNFFRKQLEETIHGLRSFKCFRHRDWRALLDLEE